MTAPSRWARLVHLDASYDLEPFTTGLESVDDWVHEKALDEHVVGRVRTHLCIDEEETILAFFALKHIIVNVDGASRRIRDTAEAEGATTGLLLAQMGVRHDLHGHGLGKAVVHEAMRTVCSLHEHAAFRLFVVDAENRELIPFYERLQFRPLRGDLRMVMKMSAVRKVVAELD